MQQDEPMRGDEVRLEELYPALQEIIVAGNDPVVDVPSSVASIELASSSSSTPAPTSTIIEETVTSPSTTTVASPIPVASPTPNTNNQEKVEDNQEKVEDNQDKISISKQLAHTQRKFGEWSTRERINEVRNFNYASCYEVFGETKETAAALQQGRQRQFIEEYGKEVGTQIATLLWNGHSRSEWEEALGYYVLTNPGQYCCTETYRPKSDIGVKKVLVTTASIGKIQMEKVNFGAIDVDNVKSVLKVFPRLQSKLKVGTAYNKLLTAGRHRMEAWSRKPWSEQVRQAGGFPTTVLSACIWNWPNAGEFIMFMSSTDNVFENEGTAGVSYLGTVIAIIEQLANSNQLNKVLQSIYGSGDATAALIQWATPRDSLKSVATAQKTGSVIRQFVSRPDANGSFGPLYEAAVSAHRKWGGDFPFHWNFFSSSNFTALSPAGKLAVFMRLTKMYEDGGKFTKVTALHETRRYQFYEAFNSGFDTHFKSLRKCNPKVSEVWKREVDKGVFDAFLQLPNTSFDPDALPESCCAWIKLWCNGAGLPFPEDVDEPNTKTWHYPDWSKFCKQYQLSVIVGTPSLQKKAGRNKQTVDIPPIEQDDTRSFASILNSVFIPLQLQQHLDGIANVIFVEHTAVSERLVKWIDLSICVQSTSFVAIGGPLDMDARNIQALLHNSKQLTYFTRIVHCFTGIQAPKFSSHNPPTRATELYLIYVTKDNGLPSTAYNAFFKSAKSTRHLDYHLIPCLNSAEKELKVQAKLVSPKPRSRTPQATAPRTFNNNNNNNNRNNNNSNNNNIRQGFNKQIPASSFRELIYTWTGCDTNINFVASVGYEFPSVVLAAVQTNLACVCFTKNMKEAENLRSTYNLEYVLQFVDGKQYDTWLETQKAAASIFLENVEPKPVPKPTFIGPNTTTPKKKQQQQQTTTSAPVDKVDSAANSNNSDSTTPKKTNKSSDSKKSSGGDSKKSSGGDSKKSSGDSNQPTKKKASKSADDDKPQQAGKKRKRSTSDTEKQPKGDRRAEVASPVSQLDNHFVQPDTPPFARENADQPPVLHSVILGENAYKPDFKDVEHTRKNMPQHLGSYYPEQWTRETCILCSECYVPVRNHVKPCQTCCASVCFDCFQTLHDSLQCPETTVECWNNGPTCSDFCEALMGLSDAPTLPVNDTQDDQENNEHYEPYKEDYDDRVDNCGGDGSSDEYDDD